MPDTVCRSCRAPIVWSVSERGKRIPLGPEAGTSGTGRFILTPDGLGGTIAVALKADDPQAGLINHFATCPDRDAWRRR